MENNVIEILFIGDIVGKPGRRAVRDYLQNNKFDFVIANVENASHGFGLTLKNHNDLIEYGIDAFTSGNHIWDKNDIYDYIDNSDRLIRPLNYPNCAYGVGYRIFDVLGKRIGVINLLGRTFMAPVDSPFSALKEVFENIKNKVDFTIVDIHAEATAEKLSLAYLAKDLGINAVIGTHTHVQTADEQIIGGKTFYITDVGFVGAKNSIIGMDIETSLKRWLTCINYRLEVPNGDIAHFDAVKFSLNQVDLSFVQVKRISLDINLSYDNEEKGQQE